MSKRILEIRKLTVAFPANIAEEEAVENLEYILRKEGRILKRNVVFKKVLDLVSFEINQGEVVGLVGESGSGKSITSLTISGLLPESAVIDSGEILFEGVNLFELSDREMRKKYRGKLISTIFQDAKGTFVPSRSIGPQIAEMFIIHDLKDYRLLELIRVLWSRDFRKFWTELRNTKKRQAKRAAIELLREASISNPEDSYDKIISELSGGEAQRASIAMMALSTKPDLLIADEATTALDVTVQKKTLDYLISVVRDKGISLLFITHDFGLVAEYADRVVVLDKGKMVESGSAQEIFSNPQSSFLIEVLDKLPRMDRPLRQKTLPKDMGDRVVEVSDFSVSFSTHEPVGLFAQKTKTKQAVNKVSLALHEGEILGIVGESGSGKTTLMRGILNTLPDRSDNSGEVYVFGNSIYSISEKEMLSLRRKISGVPQSSAQGLTPGKRVRDIVGEPFDIHKLYRSKAPYDRYKEKFQRVEELLRTVELPPERAGEVVGRFSGGEQQRIAIASTLATNPEILVLDEPTASLDASRKNTILELLIRLHAERNLSFIIISHELPTIASICDRVAVMWRGRIVEVGTPEEVFSNPLHAYTKRLVSSIPIPDPLKAKKSRMTDEEIEEPDIAEGTRLIEIDRDHFVLK